MNEITSCASPSGFDYTIKDRTYEKNTKKWKNIPQGHLNWLV